MCAMSSRMSALLCCDRASEASVLLHTVSNFYSRISILTSDSLLAAKISLYLAWTTVVVRSGMTTSGGGGSTVGNGDGSGGGGGDLDLLRDEKCKSDGGDGIGISFPGRRTKAWRVVRGRVDSEWIIDVGVV
ncbi:hypothetical protein Tco_0217885 [Tanacetum coccineum]